MGSISTQIYTLELILCFTISIKRRIVSRVSIERRIVSRVSIKRCIVSRVRTMQVIDMCFFELKKKKKKKRADGVSPLMNTIPVM